MYQDKIEPELVTTRELHVTGMFFSRTIPSSQVLKFRHTGPVEHLYETYRRIWEEYMPVSTFKLVGNWEYQYYPADAVPGIIEICLPVESEESDRSGYSVR